MEHNRVKLTIGGLEYVIVSDESAEYVRELGRAVDAAVQERMEANSRMTRERAVVLTALTECDRAHKADADADHLREQLRTYLAENEKLRAEVERLRRRG